MPRTKLARHVKQAPPIDWLWAAVLERKAVLGYDLKKMAAISGISYEYMRRISRTSPWDWPRDVREKVCKEFGINITFKPDGVGIEEVRQ